MGKKIVLGALGVVVVVAAIAAFFAATQLDRIVGNAVEPTAVPPRERT